MRSRRKLGLILMGALAVVLLVASWPAAEGPVQNGKSLSEWLACISWINPERDRNLPAARAAILAMGTNSLPYVVAWIRDADQGAFGRARAKWLYDRLPILQEVDFARDWMNDDPKLVRAYAAAQAFEFLGPIAEPALPALDRMVTERQPGAGIAMNALVRVGPAATPLLQNYLQSTNEQIRLLAAYEVREFGTNALPLLPTLAQRLSDPCESIAVSAVASLRNLQLEPGLTIPALVSALHDHRRDVRAAAVLALRKFEAQARPAVPALISALQDGDPYFRESVTNALRLIEPDLYYPVGADLFLPASPGSAGARTN